MNKLLFLDIETVCAGDPIDPMSLTPPSIIKKEETKARWYQEEAPGCALELYKKRALDSMQGRILCIGLSWDDEELIIHSENELDMMIHLTTIITQLSGKWRTIPTFVGWNVLSFDLVWLWRKAVQYNLKPLRTSINRGPKGNYIDLMRDWSGDYRDFRKLSDVAKFLSIEGKLDGIDGSMVYDLYLKGEIEKITEYCMSDVRTCREIYKRMYE